MTITFRDREQAFEAKFAHDEEFRFLAAARTDKFFARWAANKLRLDNEAAERLVKEVLAIPNGPGHNQAMLRHIAAVLAAHGAGVAEHALATALDECRQEALRQSTETPASASL